MKNFLRILAVAALLAAPATAQNITPGSSFLVIGSTPIIGGTNTRIEYNNSGALGEYTISGTGSVAMTGSPIFTGTVSGAAASWSGTDTAAALNATSLGSVSAVAYGINSAKTGLYSSAQDADVSVAVNGSQAIKFTATGTYAAWTTNGIGIVQPAQTFTDSSSTGTVTNLYGDVFGAQTIAASNSGVTYTNSYGAVFNPPVAGANVTLTNKFAQLWNGNVNANNQGLGAVAYVTANSSSGAQIAGGAASATAPSLIPNRGDTTTGYSSNGTGKLNLIAGGGTKMDYNDTTASTWTLSAATTITNATVKMTALAAGTAADLLCYASGTGLITYETTATTCAVSARRFKQDVTYLPAENSLAIIMGMKPVQFRYRPGIADGGKERHYGMIAEDVIPVAPQLVAYDPDGQTRGVKYGEMSPYLIGAIQTEQREIEALKVARLANACKHIWINGIMCW